MKSILRVERTKDFKKVHIAFWVFWVLISALLNFGLRDKFTLLTFALRVFCLNLSFFYTVYFALQFSRKNGSVNYLLRIPLLLISMGFSYALTWYYYTHIIPTTGEAAPEEINSKTIFISFVTNYIYFFLFGLMFYFFEDLVQKREEAKLAENKRHAAETAFLRAQINPHFLLNTLNFFYASAALGKSKELAAGILKLSDIMRFALTESNDKMVLLKDEIRFIEAYIELNQMRFENKLSVEYTAPAEHEVGSIKVIPLVLITLVENAFKHGELHDAKHPVRISLALTDQGRSMKFSVKNRKTMGPKERGHGIGIENTISRLQNEYGDNYRLLFSDSGDDYNAELIIEGIES